MSNNTIDPEKTLYLTCDASQVAAGYILFQIGEDGNILMISTSTRVFIRASRNKSAAFRELLPIVTGVTDQEFVIRNHKSDVIILSDSISLSLITRQKFSQNKLLEISIFLSTFSNLTVLYFPGSGQFFADALSRQFDKVYLEDKSQNISKYFAEIQPTLNKKHIGCRLNNQQFRDLLLRNSYQGNIDVFCKHEYYSMNSHRYMNYKDLKTQGLFQQRLTT